MPHSLSNSSWKEHTTRCSVQRAVFQISHTYTSWTNSFPQSGMQRVYVAQSSLHCCLQLTNWAARRHFEHWFIFHQNKACTVSGSSTYAPTHALEISLCVTCRDEIASCSERAYKQLSVTEAQKLMLFSSAKEALQFAQEVCHDTCIVYLLY